MLILSEPDKISEREIVQALAADRAQPLVLQHKDFGWMLENVCCEKICNRSQAIF